jgi:hypothetical protein
MTEIQKRDDLRQFLTFFDYQSRLVDEIRFSAIDTYMP